MSTKHRQVYVLDSSWISKGVIKRFALKGGVYRVKPEIANGKKTLSFTQVFCECFAAIVIKHLQEMASIMAQLKSKTLTKKVLEVYMKQWYPGRKSHNNYEFGLTNVCKNFPKHALAGGKGGDVDKQKELGRQKMIRKFQTGEFSDCLLVPKSTFKSFLKYGGQNIDNFAPIDRFASEVVSVLQAMCETEMTRAFTNAVHVMEVSGRRTLFPTDLRHVCNVNEKDEMHEQWKAEIRERKQQRAPSPAKARRSPSPAKARRSPSPAKARRSPSPAKARSPSPAAKKATTKRKTTKKASPAKARSPSPAKASKKKASPKRKGAKKASPKKKAAAK